MAESRHNDGFINNVFALLQNIIHIKVVMDVRSSIVTEQQGNGFYVAQFKTADLAIFSYYIESASEAILIDPTVDGIVYKQLINKRNSTLKYVLLSHYHADYVSGHNQFNVPVGMGPSAKREINKFVVQEFEDGSEIALGQIKIKVIHTPGHTPESSCYLLIDSTSAPICLFTGDTIFLGDVGRPDLAVKTGGTVEDQAAILFDSIQKIKTLDAKIRVYPGHGSGSACGKAIGGGNFCTLEAQNANNYGFKFTDKNEFVKALTAQLPKPPQYFFHDSTLNQTGLSSFEQLLEKANRPLSVEDFQGLLGKVLIVDTRNAAESIIRGRVLWLPAKGQISAWLAAAITPDEQFVLFTQPGKWQEVAERFFRIGYFNIRGYNNFSMADWKGESWNPNIVNFDQFKELKEVKHLDVRNIPEFVQTGVINNSILIPLPELHKRVVELKGEKNLVVSCRTGARARVAQSILAQEGIEAIVLSEPVDQFEAKAGIKLVPYQP